MQIPNSDLPTDDHWNYFATNYGTVDVFCEDGEGNDHHFYSTSMSPPKKAYVFFDGAATTHPGGGSKNWFYYWKYSLFGNLTNVTFSSTQEYGVCNLTNGAIVIGDYGNADYATPYENYPRFGYYRSTIDG